MTREIKFRAWDGRSIIWSDDWPNLSGFFGTRSVDEILMQFTGLKDKNGKEIYEGDIVMDFDNGSTSPNKREIRYGENDVDASYYEEYAINILGFYMTNHLGGAYGKDECEALNSQKSQNLEVIGNIYENPDLISNA